jgi:primosomal protein N' (replication factor Y)
MLFTEEKASRFADIILPLNMPQPLTYGIPHDWDELLLPGMRVEVALGRNKKYAGIILRLHEEVPENYEVKPILGVLDDIPIVNEKQLQFWGWIAAYYAAAPGEVMQAALPAHLKLIGETRLQWAPTAHAEIHEWSTDAQPLVEILRARKSITIFDLKSIVSNKKVGRVLNELLENEAILINDALEPSYKRKTEKIVSLHTDYTPEPTLHALFTKMERAPKQLELLMHFLQLSAHKKSVRQQDLVEKSGANPALVKAMADKGIFVIEEQNVDRVVFSGDESRKEIIFTPPQQKAYDDMQAALQEKDALLLQGVTGSGKTLLYIQKIRECLEEGKQALFLLPEIGLTTQLVRRLYAYFGEELGVYHSRFTNNERVEIWEKVQRGVYKVIVGPRSAMWLPFHQLGVIIADEEHDPSYKQRDPAPRFHARDAAIYLARLYKAKIILGSATPSVESLYNVQQGKYAHILLKERYKGVKLPGIELIDAKSLESVRKDGFQLLTPELQAAMIEALEGKKQIILFQNRRGYAPFQICQVCGFVPQCRNCAVSLTYHKSSDKLHCHYCGLTQNVMHNCPQCGSNKLVSRSFGTEKIEEEVKAAFPAARVARMDIDSMRGRNSLSILLEQMEKQEIDILVGTQMVVKGLDFAPVALVAILSADSLLSYPDFRVNERAFQLMEQVSGRAGRADGEGRVLIQAYNRTHPVLRWVVDHDVAAFYRHEIGYREYFQYPPFVRIIKVIFKHKEEVKAVQAAIQMAEALSKLEGIVVQGPAPGLIARLRNLYVQEIQLKCPRDQTVLVLVKNFLKEERLRIISTRGLGAVQIAIDVDPA